MPIRAKVTGLTATLRGLERIAATAAQAFEGGIPDEGDAVLRAADVIVPRDKGDLAASGKVHVSTGSHEATATVTYGGPDVPYAVRQHEDLTLTHRAGQQAKYLEAPFLAAIPGLAKRQARRVKDVL